MLHLDDDSSEQYGDGSPEPCLSDHILDSPSFHASRHSSRLGKTDNDSSSSFPYTRAGLALPDYGDGPSQAQINAAWFDLVWPKVPKKKPYSCGTMFFLSNKQGRAWAAE